MRGLKRLASARTISAGHPFVQNVRRGHYELTTDIARRTGPSQHNGALAGGGRLPGRCAAGRRAAADPPHAGRMGNRAIRRRALSVAAYRYQVLRWYARLQRTMISPIPQRTGSSGRSRSMPGRC
jgi:hypothetical protein